MLSFNNVETFLILLVKYDFPRHFVSKPIDLYTENFQIIPISNLRHFK